MTQNVPASHQQEAQKLEADALVDLFEIYPKGTSAAIYMKNDNAVSWQGKTYEGVAIKVSGDTRTADAAESRPILRIFNPEGVFNTFALDGTLDRAVVIRRRVLRTHLENNVNLSQRRMWYVYRISEVITNEGITAELRNMTEGAINMIPARIYMPPEFPFVSLNT